MNNKIVEPTPGIFPVRLIRESTTNPRKTFLGMEELTASAKRVGILQPVLLRTIHNQDLAPGEDPIVELVAGARRFRAAKAAGLQVIPGILHDLDDIEVAEIQLIENIQREDVNEYEEAESFQRLITDHKKTVEYIVDTVSESRAYVYGRLKLLDLPKSIRDAFIAAEVPASTSLLVARIAIEKLQQKAADEIIHNNGAGEPMSVRSAAKHIRDHYTLNLGSAPFPTEDGTIFQVGTCTACPKRTGNMRELYPDAPADVCTDPGCFAEKRNIFATLKADQATMEARAKAAAKPLDDADEGVESVYDVEGVDHLVPLSEQAFRFKGVRGLTTPFQRLEELISPENLPPVVQQIKMRDGSLTDLFERSAIQIALDKAGLTSTEPQSKADMIKFDKNKDTSPVKSAKTIEAAGTSLIKSSRIEAMELETVVRITSYRKARANVPVELLMDSTTEDLLRAVAKCLVNDYELPAKELSDLYPFNAMSTAEAIKYVEKAAVADLLPIILDVLVAPALTLSIHDVDEDGKPWPDGTSKVLWTEINQACSIDPEQIRGEFTPKPAKTEPKSIAKTKAKASTDTTKKATVTNTTKKVTEIKPVSDATKKKPAAKKVKPTTKPLNPAAAWPFPTPSTKVAEEKSRMKEKKAAIAASWPFPTPKEGGAA